MKLNVDFNTPLDRLKNHITILVEYFRMIYEKRYCTQSNQKDL